MKEHFLDRIYGEYQSYKASVLEESAGSIYARCYEIDCMINLYEILKEATLKMSEDDMATLLKSKHILNHLYELWLKKSDSQYAEMEHHVSDEIKKLISNSGDFAGRTAA